MPIENVTPNRGYELPAAPNDLIDDVARLIAAIMKIDFEMASAFAAIATKAEGAHGHVIADITGLAAALSARQEMDQKGEANGYASLGSDGKVPAAQLPASVFGALSYQGTWNASTNSPAIPSANAGNKGHYYKVSTAGTTSISGINDWEIGDWVVSNGVSWDKIDNTDQVLSVAGLRGAITAVALKAALEIAVVDIAGLGNSATRNVGTEAGTVPDSGAVVYKDGGAMSADPTEPLGVATKQYVDNLSPRTETFEFLSSGTFTMPGWVKPDDIVEVEMWGGGGSGGVYGGGSAGPGGGGGGGYKLLKLIAADVGASASILIGAGGVGGGIAGGTTSFGSFGSAYGGSGGRWQTGSTSGGGGGGGGDAGPGAGANGGGGAGGQAGGAGMSLLGEGASGGSNGNGQTALMYGGGGGGGGQNNGNATKGGNSMYGGGGGAGGFAAGDNGGRSTYGGNGGGADANSPAQVPGGGGGASSRSGASGKCIVRVIKA